MTALTGALAAALERQLLVEKLADCFGSVDSRAVGLCVSVLLAFPRERINRADALATLDSSALLRIRFGGDRGQTENRPDSENETERRGVSNSQLLMDTVSQSWDEIERLLVRIRECPGKWNGPFVRYGRPRIEAALHLAREVSHLSRELVRSLPDGKPLGDFYDNSVRLIDEVSADVLCPLLREALPEEAAYLLECVPEESRWGSGLGGAEKTLKAMEGALGTLLWRALAGTTAMEPEDFEAITDWAPYRTTCVPLVLALVKAAKRGAPGVGDPFDWFVILGDLLEDRWFRWTRREPADLLEEATQSLIGQVDRGELTADEAGIVAREAGRVLVSRHTRSVSWGPPRPPRSSRVRRALSAVLAEVGA